MRLFQVDAFTDRAFSGNAAAVVIPEPGEELPSADWMQRFAAEMNLSETAYLDARPSHHEGILEYGLRWFTPQVEVDLCGHATLASAHVLLRHGFVEEGMELRFHTRSGVLRASAIGDLIDMDFPTDEMEPAELPVAAAEGLDLGAHGSVLYVGESGKNYYIQVDSATAVTDCKPDFARLREVEGRCFVVTAASDDDTFDFVSRFFATGVGIEEDPVTGSIHCALGKFWGEKLDKKNLRAFQASNRGGVLELNWRGDRMGLQGSAVTVLEGSISIDH